MSPAEIKEENRKRRILASKFGNKTSAARKRLIKDPNAPKRPPGSYVRFMLEHVTPGQGLKEVAKETGSRWKALSEAEKRV
jgi:hypothetical protein